MISRRWCQPRELCVVGCYPRVPASSRQSTTQRHVERRWLYQSDEGCRCVTSMCSGWHGSKRRDSSMWTMFLQWYSLLHLQQSITHSTIHYVMCLWKNPQHIHLLNSWKKQCDIFWGEGYTNNATEADSQQICKCGNHGMYMILCPSFLNDMSKQLTTSSL